MYNIKKKLSKYYFLMVHEPIYSFRTIDDLVKSLEKTIHGDSEFDMIVRRSHVVSDALRRMDKAFFDPRSYYK